MTVRLRFFASLRERAGHAEADRELPGPTSVGALWEVLQREHARLADFKGRVAFAVNREYVDSDHLVQENDEIAFIPPVSGGSNPRDL
jgi:molybdopterin synthase sulfur carrier subunit